MKVQARVPRASFPLILVSLVMAIGCGAARSDNIRELVRVEAEALERLEASLGTAEETMREVVSTLREVRGTSSREGGFLWQLDRWVLEVGRASFLTEVLTTPPADPDIRRAVLVKIAVIRETHEKAEKVLEDSLARAEQELTDSYAGLTRAVGGLRRNLETVQRYTESSTRDFVLTSADAQAIAAVAREVEGAGAALENARAASGRARQVISFVSRFSSSSSLDEAMAVAGSLQELLARIEAAGWGGR